MESSETPVLYRGQTVLTEVFRLLFLPMYRTVLPLCSPAADTGSISYSYHSAKLASLTVFLSVKALNARLIVSFAELCYS